MIDGKQREETGGEEGRETVVGMQNKCKNLIKKKVTLRGITFFSLKQ